MKYSFLSQFLTYTVLLSWCRFSEFDCFIVIRFYDVLNFL